VAQREAEIQPDGVLDDLGREAVAAVPERGHADTLPDMPLTPDPVSVTMPARQPDENTYVNLGLTYERSLTFGA